MLITFWFTMTIPILVRGHLHIESTSSIRQQCYVLVLNITSAVAVMTLTVYLTGEYIRFLTVYSTKQRCSGRLNNCEGEKNKQQGIIVAIRLSLSIISCLYKATLRRHVHVNYLYNMSAGAIKSVADIWITHIDLSNKIYEYNLIQH